MKVFFAYIAFFNHTCPSGVAQLVESRTVNAVVEGSSPSARVEPLVYTSHKKKMNMNERKE